jgi:hypothetical protein
VIAVAASGSVCAQAVEDDREGAVADVLVAADVLGGL